MNSDKTNTSGNAYWDEVADTVGGYYLIPELAEYKNHEYIDLLESWGVVPDETILITDLYEAALGNTGINNYLNCLSNDVWGMDISAKFCFRARENFKRHNIESGIMAGDATEMPLADDTVDVIISPSTFDHFPQIDQALKECYRILKPGGKLVLALNSADNPFFKLGVRLAERFKKNEYQTDYFYSLREAEGLLRQAGFSPGRSTAIVHIPIGVTTVMEILAKPGNHFFDKLNELAIRACEGWGRMGGRLKRYTGWWVVVEGIK